ncbi:MAG: homoserine kinase [Elusimicrobia bacterium]|nr:homoserine kinase [Elusimicrobiota bacterium]
MKKVWIRVPGSSGNLGSGFDVAAAALGVYLELELEVVPKAQGMPYQPKNLIVRTAWPLLQKAFPKNGFRFRSKDGIPMGKGLGSSAAARLAALVAARLLTKREDHDEETLTQAARLEGHPDNAAASLYGGFCLSWFAGGKVQAYSRKMPRELAAVICIPSFNLPTEKARRILPKSVPRQDAVFNLGRLASLFCALETKQFGQLKSALEDRLHQPYRARLIPGLNQVIESALKSGALGACLSGAGPSVLAVVDQRKDPGAIGEAMERAFAGRRIQSRAQVYLFDNKGFKSERN